MEILRKYYDCTTGHYGHYGHYGFRGKIPWFADVILVTYVTIIPYTSCAL